MKKFFGVIVAVMLCACLLVPTAFAADDSATDIDSIIEQIRGADLGSLTEDDLSTILGDLGLSDLDIEGLVEQFEGDDSNEALDTLNNIAEQLNTVDAENSGGTINDTSSFDIAKIIELIPVDFDTKPIADMLSSLTDGGLASLMSSVGTLFNSSGIDLASEEVGEFDIASLSVNGNASVENAVAGSTDLAASLTNLTAGLADTLVSTLETLGLDSSTIEGLLDNEIVNFFANMYIGFIGEVEESTTAAPTTAPTTKPAVVTTTTPKTGDTSAVIVALSTLTVASAAAFVCLKKKKEV